MILEFDTVDDLVDAIQDRPTYWTIYFDEEMRQHCVIQTFISGETLYEFYLEDGLEARVLCALLNKLEFGLQLTEEQLGD